ncbi:MAG: helix-turn-helix domain-containing protein [Phycisphaeraceae bacterium]
MAYRKQTLSQYNGRYARTIGKVLSGGEPASKRFLLGTDKAAAEMANKRLEMLWSEVESDFRRRRQRAKLLQPLGELVKGIEIEPLTGKLVDRPVNVLTVEPVWELHTLAIAEAVRKGEHEVLVQPAPPLPSNIIQPDKNEYIHRIMDLRERYSVIAFSPSDPTLYGRQLEAIRTTVEHEISRAETSAHRAQALTKSPMRTRAGKSIYEAIDAYAAHAEQSKAGGTNEPTDAVSLKASITNLPLSSFDYDAIQMMGDYWRSRPATKRYGGKGAPIAVNTVRNRLKTARRFVRWLNRASKWDWRCPPEWEEALKMDEQRMLTETEKLVVSSGPETWTVEELVTMYAYATDRERVFILFGLNFGFAQSEVISFRHEDIKLDLKPPQINRVRRKTRKYFEAAIWPETLEALKWLADHQTRKAKGNDAWVLLTEKGTRFDSNAIANRWNGLLKRIRVDHPNFRRLPFKHLRKTAYQLVLEAIKSHEVAGAFEARSRLSSDLHEGAYGRRLFAKVFEANELVRERLQPAFLAAPNAFKKSKSKGSPNVSPGTIAEIQRLGHEGLSVPSIAEQVGVSRQTVHRWLGRDSNSPSSGNGESGR